MRRKILFLLSVVVLTACSTCKVEKSTSIHEIQFGNGGGFTGIVTSYSLKSNGILLKEGKKISKLSCDSLEAIFEIAEQLPKENFVHPNNTYSFIKVFSDGKTYYYSWSCGNMVPHEKIIDLHNKLMRQL